MSKTKVAVNCSNCLKLLDAATGVNKGEPKEGDISICFYCAQVCIYKEDLTLRNITELELQQMAIQFPETFFHVMMGVQLIKSRISKN